MISSLLPVKAFDQYTVAEQEFIDQRTRQLTTNWADQQIQFGTMPKDDGRGLGLVYFEYAKAKKWLNADGTKLTSAGLMVAARFLKR